MFYLEYLLLLDIIHDITIDIFVLCIFTVDGQLVNSFKTRKQFYSCQMYNSRIDKFYWYLITLFAMRTSARGRNCVQKKNNDHFTHTFPSQVEASPLLLDTFFKSSTLPWKNRQQTASWSLSWSFFSATINFQNSTSSDFYMARDLSWLRLSRGCFAA